jgi:hypothetical protein
MTQHHDVIHWRLHLLWGREALKTIPKSPLPVFEREYVSSFLADEVDVKGEI